MDNYQAPLAIYFVWHPDDSEIIKPLVDYILKYFQRDIKKPFSRNINLPVFFRTSSNQKIPKEVESLAQKQIIFCFSSINVTSDEKWKEYYDTFHKSSNNVIPIALDSKYSFKLNDSFRKINYIRYYDFQKNISENMFFISILHEIIRFGFQNTEKKKGEETALKLFISHTKIDNWAVKLAEDLKTTIDNSSMKRFFDVQDIHPGYEFNNEINENLKKSTLISILSDNYSSRYWCQKEVLVAKKNKRPMIVVNYLRSNEDRVFPYAANIPLIRIDFKDDVLLKNQYHILELALLETLRFNYYKLQLEIYCNDETLLICRPPEPVDLININNKIKKILYPEPPLYVNELEALIAFPIKDIVTPLTMEKIELKGISIGISISDPEDEEILNLGHNKNHLISLSQCVARYLLSQNSTLVYGGDFRDNGFTKYLVEEARIVQDRLGVKKIELLRNYIAWPIYKKDDLITKQWKSEYSDVAKMIEVVPPNMKHNPDVFYPPDNPENCYLWSMSLTKMREEMISKCKVRICAGGRFSGYKGKYPGILEEIIIAIEKNKPLYLIGGFGGVTSRVCSLLTNKTSPEELMLNWQIKHNYGYSDLIEKISEEKDYRNINYDEVTKNILDFGIEGLSKKNGLTVEENKKLFQSEFVYEVIFLILKGISNLIEKGELCPGTMSL